MTNKIRLDKYLYENKLADSRTRASNLIKLGKVSVNNVKAQKCSQEVSIDDIVEITGFYQASLGGIKLEEAFKVWQMNANNKICLDVGASNGGFTEVLLHNGAGKVYALDIGKCALPEYLKNDIRVIVKDNINARYITTEDFPDIIDLAVIDVSFISLEKILLPIFNIIRQDGEIIALIKPQFELTKKDLSKSGIIKNKNKQLEAVSKIRIFVENIGGKNIKIIAAPHPFEEKNQEFLIHFIK